MVGNDDERRPKGRSIEDVLVRLLGSMRSSASDPRIATFVLLAARDPALGLVLYQV
jgi:hypothetical protein